ncbi:Cache domain-containing protein [Eubacterium aggregans]|uniref:Cache domain-containing protein n=1 Tax=Eubacterium aggregans TaxID=81409 RepID=A0A1H4EQ78_9FIRM|nr:Cache domain-containing protein [Eubacterium aggregans]
MFIISLFISVACYGALIFTNWVSSAEKTTAHMAADINEEIYNQVYSLMQAPYHMNEVNHKVIENGMLDWSDEKQRDRFFVSVVESHSNSIYSFSYGTANGEYYGARRNENGVVEIMQNNADTGGNSWYYSVNEDLTAGDLVVQAGKFDPRTRAWYKAAVEAGGPVFSPLYKHFVMDDLTVSAAWPVYNESGNLDGVLGTHMLLSDIGSFLKDAVEEHNGIAIIIEKDSNYLVANSMDVSNFAVLEDGTLERYALKDIDNTDIQNAYEQYKTNSATEMIYKGENDNFFVNISEIHMNGIDWV